MILYVISKNRYYFSNCLNVGLKRHWDFVQSPKHAKFYDTLQEAERTLQLLEKEYKGPLDCYKGQFKIRKFELKEV